MEEWKNIKGSKGKYQVSSCGSCQSFLKYKEGVILNLFNHKDQYLMAVFSMRHFKMTCRLNKLVAEYFIPNPNNFKHVRNIDGNFRNNNVENLEWCDELITHQRAILTETEVLEIYDAINDKKTFKYLAEKYGVCTSTIGDIKSGRCWKKLIRKGRNV